MSAPVLIASCQTVDATGALKVTNGDPTAPFPASVRIQSGSSYCTGSFLTDQLMVTAAHCLKSPDPVFFRRGGEVIESLRYVPHPAFQGKVGENDVGLIWFPPGSASATVGLCANDAKVNDPVLLVGYGCNDMTQMDTTGTCSGSGILRVGHNRIASVADGSLSLVGGVVGVGSPQVALGQQSMTGKGDSGGPWLSEGCLVGITSGGSSSVSVATSLHAPSVAGFMQAHSARLLMPPTQAPPPPMPVVEMFEVEKGKLRRSESTVLSWKVIEARSVEILADGQVIATGLIGALRVSPQQTTSYTLRYTDERGALEEYIFPITVEVGVPPERPVDELLDEMTKT